LIIPHRGKGIFILVFGVVAALLMNILSSKVFGGDYYRMNLWPKVGTLWLAALACFLFGAYLQAHPSVDKSERKPRNGLSSDAVLGLLEKGARLEPKDHLLFVPVIYWGAIYLLIGLVYAVVKSLGRE
jgi:hypothetical protein